MARSGMSLALAEREPDARALGPAILPLLRELGDLKRIRSAGRPGSIAERLFRSGWAALANGAEPAAVMVGLVSGALAAARLGDLDRDKLAELGLEQQAATAVLERAFDEVTGPLDPELVQRLRPGLAGGFPRFRGEPAFVQRLAEQPRAGVTCPGLPRLMLQPAENHAEHCLAVTVYGVLLAPLYGADPTPVFLAGMAHHLHSADMPDSGFTGEVLLGDWLEPVVDAARDRALAELPASLRIAVRLALDPIQADATPEARAFHAADVIDRVLEIEQHLTAARATMTTVLDEYHLVHAGLVKPFHDHVLRAVGLA